MNFILLLCLALPLNVSAASHCAPEMCDCCPDSGCGVCHFARPQQDRSTASIPALDLLLNDASANYDHVHGFLSQDRIIRVIEEAALANLIFDSRGHPSHGPPRS